jgi:hypothetical protein
MSLLSIARSIAINAGIAIPTEVLSSLSSDAQKIVQFTQEAGEEIARRVDWGALRKTATITGTGSNDDFGLPTDFARLVSGNSVTIGGVPVRVGISADEWNSLTAISGTPRYARLIGSSISFYPYPVLSASISVSYQSKNWCGGGTSWSNDTDAGLVPEILIEQGAKWRWRRQLGSDYQDQLAEFESSLAEYAKSDDGMRLP